MLVFFATARNHAVLNFEQATDLKVEKIERILDSLGKLVDADFFMIFKNSASMAMDPEGERIQETLQTWTLKLTAIANLIKSFNAKLEDDSKKGDEAEMAAARLAFLMCMHT